MTTIRTFQELVKELLNRKHYSEEIAGTLQLIMDNKMSRYFFEEYLDSQGIRLENIKTQTLDVVLDYAEMILEDDSLTEDEIQTIRLLRIFFSVEEGDFAMYGKLERVEHIIIDQMEKLYADNTIDATEMLHKSEVQGLFGLGYDEYQEIVNKVAIQAYSRGADIRNLDTYL